MLTRICIALLACWLPAAAIADLAAQRAAFDRALYAAKRGNTVAVERYRTQLDDYPLTPYLDYYLLGNSFSRSGNDDIERFIANAPGLPVNARLRRDWLAHLAGKGRWGEFLDAWQPQDETFLRCHWVNAHLRTDRAGEAGVAAQAVELWLAGRSQPDACDPVFAWLDDSGRMTPALVHARMQLALQAGQYSLAGWLAQRLDPADRDYVDRWRRMQYAPARELAAAGARADTERERRLLVAGMERLARQQPAQARAYWNWLDERFAFTAQDRHSVLRLAALIAAQRHEQDALAWLAELEGVETTVDEWRVRSAIRDSNWQAALDALDALPEATMASDGWLYWRARSLEQLGEDRRAAILYDRIAGHNGYHAWLAADRLGREYDPGHSLTVADESLLARLAAMPGIIRAREFLALGMIPHARSEWNAAISELENRELVQAALLAHRWQWHSQAIATLGRAREFSDLEIRYPLVFDQQILPAARLHDLDPALVYSLVRSESGFAPDARSVAGALGLMQLMPGTGRDVARMLGMRPPNRRALLDPDTNVRLGSAYLNTVLNRFGNHEILATAAYNAGPHRVQRWIPDRDGMQADVWIETIPYNETRNYVQRVMGGTVVFDWRMGQPARRLSTRMRDIPAAE